MAEKNKVESNANSGEDSKNENLDLKKFNAEMENLQQENEKLKADNSTAVDEITQHKQTIQELQLLIDEQSTTISAYEKVNKSSKALKIFKYGKKSYTSRFSKIRVKKNGILVVMSVEEILQDEEVMKNNFDGKLPEFLTEV
jgi:glutamate mutase epsilon subunit